MIRHVGFYMCIIVARTSMSCSSNLFRDINSFIKIYAQMLNLYYMIFVLTKYFTKCQSKFRRPILQAQIDVLSLLKTKPV